jgi:hypothetical protein
MISKAKPAPEQTEIDLMYGNRNVGGLAPDNCMRLVLSDGAVSPQLSAFLAHYGGKEPEIE